MERAVVAVKAAQLPSPLAVSLHTAPSRFQLGSQSRIRNISSIRNIGSIRNISSSSRSTSRSRSSSRKSGVEVAAAAAAVGSGFGADGAARRKGRVVVARVSEEQVASSEDSEKAGKEPPRAHLKASKLEKLVLEESERPLAEYMSLPASQYSVLDAERIERVDDNTFLCYVYRLKFFTLEICPVLLVRVDEKPDGCSITLLACTLDGSSPLETKENEKFKASMVNNVSWRESDGSPTARELVSDATIQVTLDIPFAFRAFPVEILEGTGNQVLGQVLRVMLPRFLDQLGKDYRAWASGDASRRPLGTGEI